MTSFSTPKLFNTVPGTLDWLLEPSNPIVRYNTTTLLLKKKSQPPKLSEDPWVRYMFRAQKGETYWESRSTCYYPKYSSTVWRLQVLADLGLTRADKRISNAVEFFLRLHQSRDGGFSAMPQPQGRSHICLTGNMAAALLKFGYAGDSKLWRAVEWLLGFQMADGGWNCFMDDKPTHSSFNSTFEPLAALLELPAEKRSKKVKDAIARANEFLLKHRLFRSCKTGEIINRNWLKLFYPHHAHYNYLIGLRLLAKQGLKDPRMQDAIDLLASQATPDGRWSGKILYKGAQKNWVERFALHLEPVDRPSKWLTLQALLVLKDLALLEFSGRTDGPRLANSHREMPQSNIGRRHL